MITIYNGSPVTAARPAPAQVGPGPRGSLAPTRHSLPRRPLAAVAGSRRRLPPSRETSLLFFLTPWAHGVRRESARAADADAVLRRRWQLAGRSKGLSQQCGGGGRRRARAAAPACGAAC